MRKSQMLAEQVVSGRFWTAVGIVNFSLSGNRYLKHGKGTLKTALSVLT